MAIATLELSLDVEASAGGTVLAHEGRYRWAPTVLRRETVSCTGSAFTALTVPSGATALVVLLPNTAVSLTLKGVTGDGTGVAIVPASNFIGLPIVLPLGATPSIGILNAGATVSIEAIWI